MSFALAQSSQTTASAQFPLAEFDHVLAKLAFHPVTASNVDRFHAVADGLIEGEIASAADIWRVQHWTRRSVYLRDAGNGPDAILAAIPMTRAGARATLDGSFSFNNAQRDWVCGLDEEAEALLCWGMAGQTPIAQTASLMALLACWTGFYNRVRVYTRARSSDGRKLMRRLGFSLCASPDGVPVFGSNGIPEAIAARFAKQEVQR